MMDGRSKNNFSAQPQKSYEFSKSAQKNTKIQLLRSIKMNNKKKNLRPQVSAPVERPASGSGIIGSQPSGGLEVYGGVGGAFILLY